MNNPQQKKIAFCATWIMVLFFMTTYAQTTKGIVESSAETTNIATAGNVYALIVGVSNYPYVKPLNFAEEDALLFFEFLRSKAGGEVPENHIKLLLNEQATHANVTAGLAWLNSSTGAQPQPGDRVYIYLSGHGDAYDASEAYYLCYDSNPAGDKNNYQLGGALDIGKMKKRVAAMVNKGVEVILVVDACRSGDVPGVRSGIGNPYQSVIEEPVGEVLLLSAGPNQFALEDRRWGGGHGGFTWYLIKGLSGEADVDGDGAVSLFEIEIYTKTKVVIDTKQMGAPQTPHICCESKFDFILSKKDDAFSQRVRSEESGNTKVGLTALAARDALEKAMFENEALKQAYFSLKIACKEQRYLGSNSAWSIWEDCKGKYTAQEIEPIRMYLMGALAAEGQKAINEEMNVGFDYSPGFEYYQSRREWVDYAIKIMVTPDEIAGIKPLRDFIYAIELSNSVSFAYPFLDSIMYICRDSVIRSKTIEPFDRADSLFKQLERDYVKSAAFHYLLQNHQAKWDFYFPEKKNTNRKKEITKAMELAPSWAKPIHAAIMMHLLEDEELAEKIDTRLLSDPNNFENHYLGYYQSKLQLPLNRKKAEESLQKAFDLHPSASLTSAWLSEKFPGYFYFGSELYKSKFEDFYPLHEEDWTTLRNAMEKYQSSPFREMDCAQDSTFEIRSFVSTAVAIAVRLHHEKEALDWIKKENALCKSVLGLMSESILYKYVFNDEKTAQQRDEEALQFKIADEVILDLFGVKKESIPLERRELLIYKVKRMFTLLPFFRDDWIESELLDFEKQTENSDAEIFLTTGLRAYLNKHVELHKTDFEKWNTQLNLVRRVNRPELAFYLFVFGVQHYNLPDSTVIFLKDLDLEEYAEGLKLNHIAIPLILTIPESQSITYLDSCLRSICEGRKIKKDLFLNFLALSKANKRFLETPFFNENYTNLQKPEDKLLLFQVFLNLEDYSRLGRAFDAFDWSNPQSKIPPAVVLTVIFQMRLVKDYALLERMLDTLIPFVFNAKDQDYSDSVNLLHTLFDFSKKPEEAMKKSPEFQRVAKKYVLQ